MAKENNSKVTDISSKNQQQLERALGNLISAKQVLPKPVEELDEDVLLSDELEEDNFDFDDDEQESQDIPLDTIKVSSYRLRNEINDEKLNELVRSITNRGVLQPVILRHIDSEDHEFELVAGERRWRAAQLAGFEKIPAIVGDFSDQDSVEIAIIENAQREDLNPIEEARSYKILGERFSMNQKAIADAVGKNRSSISNSLRLLTLEDEIIELIIAGDITAGHARALLGVEEGLPRLRLAAKVVTQAMSVRALEALISNANAGEKESKESSSAERLSRLENRISEYLDLEAVKLTLDRDGRKRLNMTFPTEAAWKRFVAKIRD